MNGNFREKRILEEIRKAIASNCELFLFVIGSHEEVY